MSNKDNLIDENKSLRREVAMLRDVLVRVDNDAQSGRGKILSCGHTWPCGCSHSDALKVISNTQATAEAYERELKVKVLEGQWIPSNSDNKPMHGEDVLVMTTDCDGDKIAVTANYNGKNLYLRLGGKKVSPALAWMQIPELRAQSAQKKGGE